MGYSKILLKQEGIHCLESHCTVIAVMNYISPAISVHDNSDTEAWWCNVRDHFRHHFGDHFGDHRRSDRLSDLQSATSDIISDITSEE